MVDLFQQTAEISVKRTEELRRIVSLPRRTWTEEAEEWSRDLTETLKTPGGSMSLRPIQAIALAELGMYGGLFAPIRVGGGKTLISLLAPVVAFAKRPLLLVPASLLEKTKHDDATLRAHWDLGPWIRMMSYEWLGRKQASEALEAYAPDLIVADECHRLKNTKTASCTRRVRRYMREHPETKFVAMSGTITKRSLLDYAHILFWCLQPADAPLPRTYNDLEVWADALDERKGQIKRVDPGALIDLCDDSETELWKREPRRAARLAYRRRLTETPAVVASNETPIDASIRIQAISPKVPQEIDDAFFTLRKRWETPDGWPIADGLGMFRHARELALGFFYVWDPRPPKEWLDARKAWAAYVRKILKRSRTLDSELQVREAHEDAPECQDWLAVRDIFEPNTVPVWICDDVLDVAIRWAEKNRGIVWTEHACVGERLQEKGLPHFGRRGVNQNGTMIEHFKGRACAASIASNATGRNLQRWSRNLILGPLANGLQTEQLLGRTHRDGQEADEVSFDLLVTCAEHVGAFWQSMRDAEYVHESTGAPQKLLLADVSVPRADEIANRRGPRWAKRI